MADKNFRVRAVRGFRALVDGTFGVVNPGDVVDLASKDDYISVLSTNRAVAVDEKTPLARAKAYVPEYKRERLGKPAAKAA